MARSTNITRDLLDRIRNAGRTGKHRDIYDHQQGFMVRVTPAGVISFCYRYRRPDGRYGRTTIGRYPGLTVSEARARALKLTQDLEHKCDTPGEIIRKREKASSDAKAAMVVPTINGFLDDHYGKHLRLKAPKKENAQRTVDEIRKLGDALPGPLNTIDEKTVLDWVYAELEKEIGPDRYMKSSTVARKLKSLRGLFTLAVAHGIIGANPVAEVQNNHPALLDEGEGRDVWLTADMERRLRDALDRREADIRAMHEQISSNPAHDPVYRPDDAFIDHVKPAIIVSFRTGLRRGEQMQLTWRDVDFERERIRVRRETSKGLKTRYVSMCQEVIDILAAWKAQTCRDGVQPILVFGNAAGERRREVKAWRDVLHSAQIEDFVWQDLRHTFATHLAIHGVPIERISKWLGHASIQQTMRYSHHCPDQQREHIRMLDRRTAANETRIAA